MIGTTTLKYVLSGNIQNNYNLDESKIEGFESDY